MLLQDAIVNRVYITKSGETVISFKVKPEDLPPEQRETLLEYWRDGTLLQFTVERFQDENQEDTAKEETPLKSKPESVYAKIEKWFALNKGKNEYEKFKGDLFFRKWGTPLADIEIKATHLSDLLTEEEAEKEFSALEKAMTKNL